MNRLQSFQIERLEGNEEFIRLRERLEKGEKAIPICGLAGSSLAYILAALCSKRSHPLLLIASNRERAEQMADDMQFFGVQNVFHFPDTETLPYELDEPHVEIAARQIESYEMLCRIADGEEFAEGKAPVIIAPLESLLQKILAPEFYRQKRVRIRWGQTLDINDLCARLVDIGYERSAVVEARGEFSVRGGIIDIFALPTENPIRIDLFGREVESIRPFDSFTQRSFQLKDTLEEVAIPPAKLVALTRKSIEANINLAVLLDYLSANALIVLDEPDAFEPQSERFEQLVEQQYFEASAHSEQHTPPERLYSSWSALHPRLGAFAVISHSQLSVLETGGAKSIRFASSSFEDVRPSFEHYLELIKTRQLADYHINVVCDNEGQLQRFDELLREHEISAASFIPGLKQDLKWSPEVGKGGLRDIVLSIGNLHEGFSLSGAQTLFITDREIFGRYKRRHVYRRVYKGAPIAAPTEIARDEFVVHVDHGIGKFLGIRTQMIDGRKVDLLEILYSDDARLLVPVDKIRLIQKYSIVENVQPSLDELGSKAWLARKKKTEEKIEQMADELLNLYARRTIANGYSYSSDTVWQSEFESSFIYEETLDQLTAIEQVKRDLEMDKPMDRLVCGDVGYGKTEVALRAAFKVVQEGKQVAVLAPTTILCQQHYNTFSERYAEYPYKVEMLSRFRTASEQRKILERVKNGEVHVIVGTHRLLSKDVAFSDLGLVIVDEEQRFGVQHKERLKEMRTSVDFLTLTATPIPRTLYMALSGLRDLSIINTPPPNRLPIKTRMIHWDDELIREAILRELNRGGQIFFVHNRIQNIDYIAERLKKIHPALRIAIAHGRLNENELEHVMLDFVDQKYDALLSTSIIENGLDIPNVNTIIINRADAFGLAQLYQLRGRVGRDVKQAYAYLITPAGEAITDAAIRRLAAINEFTELGVGFNIAMRDLEIRGSGNLLGKEQHGCIVSVGFDYYCSLLEKTVRRLKGEHVEDLQPPEIKWNVEGYLPADYIPVESQRVGIYKRLSEALKRNQLQDINDELKDRYGAIPLPVENLIKVSELRIAAMERGVRRIIETPQGYKLSLRAGADIAEFSRNLQESRRSINDKALIKAEDDETIVVQYANWRKLPRLEKAIHLLSAKAAQE